MPNFKTLGHSNFFGNAVLDVFMMLQPQKNTQKNITVTILELKGSKRNLFEFITEQSIRVYL